ncbi:dCTP deaminase domain-containing protein [Candidatus Poriferisodalis sp.]|uniref:dCTP deaminase domain-containing protein n=1 Tax=Candidatus Poriferisodalis sp. TaxID=3101277 RepID=UPI003B024EE7
MKDERLVTPFDQDRIANCSYELSMGPQALLTGEDQIRRDLANDEQLRIPSGHFAQLMTEEKVRIPPDALGLISMKSQVKRLGLVNVSGFHVDPGFHGRLRFSVYNAGPSSVYISRGTPTFLIWFTALDTPTDDLYEGHGGRPAFTDQDTMEMQGDVFTPQVLADRMATIERKIGWRIQLGSYLAGTIVGAIITLLFQALT